MTRMLRIELDALLDDILRPRRLLAHPFYRRWEAGSLEPGELGSYAAQYRHFEAVLPEVLERIADALPVGRARQLVEANLADERAVPAPHLELFDAFAGAVGAPVTDTTPATAALVELYLSVADTSPVAALAAVAAYEVQAPAIGTSTPGWTRRTAPGCSRPWPRWPTVPTMSPVRPLRPPTPGGPSSTSARPPHRYPPPAEPVPRPGSVLIARF